MTITLSPSQQNVIDQFPAYLLNDDGAMTISGFAGSGKSFMVKYLADMGSKQQQLVKLIDPSIPYRTMHFTATTNKAAIVLRSFLGREVSTIHRLLGLKVKNDYRTGKSHLTDDNNCKDLTHSIVFIDEASMVNRELLNVVRSKAAKFKDCKLIYIGDRYQLPPVKEDMCPVFDNGPNTFNLNEIQRQAEGSPIIELSAKYRACLDDHTLDWPVVKSEGIEIIHYDDKTPFFRQIEHRFTRPHTYDDYKVVAWANNRVRDYNSWIRNMIGRKEQYEVGETMVTNKPLFHGRSILAPTDSFHTISSVKPTNIDGIDGYKLELELFPDTYFFQPADWAQADKLSRVYAAEAKNGDSSKWTDFFDIKERWTDLRPVHASTVHKSQGSTYREVFVDLNNIGKCTRWRDVARLVYVAITRASDTVHIFGQLTGNYHKSAPINLMEAFKNVDCL
jgi:hypothetical protein